LRPQIENFDGGFAKHDVSVNRTSPLSRACAATGACDTPGKCNSADSTSSNSSGSRYFDLMIDAADIFYFVITAEANEIAVR